jgi:Holliday junction DNA helicase RuvB
MTQPALSQDVPKVLALEEGLPFDKVEQRIGIAYAAAGLRHRVVAFYLQDVDARRLHQLAGFKSTPRYAMARFGMSRREARELLAAGKALQDLPLIDDAFAEGKLCWSKVRELIKIATPRHEDRWLEVALRLPIDQLSLEVRLARAGEAPRDHDERKGLPEVRLRLNTPLPPDVYAKWEQARRKVEAESGRPLEEWEYVEALIDLALSVHEDGSVEGKVRGSDSCYCAVVHTDANTAETEDGDVPVSPETVEMIACDAGVIDASDPNAAADRHVPAALRRKVLGRDGHRCAGCRSPHRLQLHHIVPFNQGGPTCLENLLTLCRGCHARVHGGLMEIITVEKGMWRFVDKDGNDLDGPEAPPGRFLSDPDERLQRHPVEATVLHDLPAEIDGAWWRRHAHLVRWNEAQGTLELHPGLPAEDRADEPEVAQCATPPTSPARLADLSGQRDVISSLEIALEAARRLDEAFGHTLLTGAPGLGKTTIAHALAGELGARLHTTRGPLLKNPLGVVRLLGGLRERDVVFIDELHALPQAIAEVLYGALDDGRLDLLVTCAGQTRTVTLRLAPFTLIGATTDEGLLPEAFLSRFENQERLSFYDPRELAEVITRAAPARGLEIDADAARELAEVSRQAPREALRLLRRVRTAAAAAGRQRIDLAVVARTLDRLGIDGRGLGPVDRAYLGVLEARGPDRPLGLHRAAVMLGISPTTLERVYEPYLFRLGLISTTPRGRVVHSPQCRPTQSCHGSSGRWPSSWS